MSVCWAGSRSLVAILALTVTTSVLLIVEVKEASSPALSIIGRISVRILPGDVLVHMKDKLLAVVVMPIPNVHMPAKPTFHMTHTHMSVRSKHCMHCQNLWAWNLTHQVVY